MSITSLQQGQIVKVRSRQYVVEDYVPSDHDTRVRLACLEDDALGEQLEVFWEREIDRQILGNSSWEAIAGRGFDQARLFSAYLHTLRWNCVTATEPKLFQAPYRAGIEVKAYQLEPLRKALLMPRVALFIADDVGLGKTIEAGLILREMLMRQKVRRVVIAAPPSVVRQWQEEMESRFGLTFVVLDREFIAQKRRERGFGINPWTTHTRFIISHSLIRDESYAAPLRDWLGDFAPGSMLILDEAHNAAPASGTKYAVDSQLTRTIREIADRFEHKLFLSATPHNGHSNSFASLLEMLDPQRFCRGVKVNDKLRDEVMVRRLKRDLRELGDDFPKREVIPIPIKDLPNDAPELLLSRLLQDYRQLREERLKSESRSKQNAALLVMINLQKRLLSSVEAFVRTLKVHRNSVEKQVIKQTGLSLDRFSLLQDAPIADDDRAELSEGEVEYEEETQMAIATEQSTGVISPAELQLLDQMLTLATGHRNEPDARVKKLAEWIKENLCPDLGKPNAPWLDRRVLIFTEYTDTKRYLEQQLGEIIAGSDQAEERIGIFQGGMGDDKRELIKTAFNTDPAKHPLRILIATDAAREGVNLQNYCADLFHFDVPWNPSRMEQRNGRIDRKLQRAKVVRCYYFVLTQREEDRVLEVLVEKTRRIQEELGSLTPVVEKNIHKLFEQGIRRQDSNQLCKQLEGINGETKAGVNLGTVAEELETIRPENKKLAKNIEELQKLLQESKDWLGLEDRHFREALSVSLEMQGIEPLQPLDAKEVAQNVETARWEIPALDQVKGADPNWMNTLDTLRRPRAKGQKPWEWRQECPVRPVVFRDPGSLDGDVVHLHLEHRIVQRLLSKFLSQGFLHHELSRACVCLTDNPTPKVIALGRLSLYGAGAARLHDEIVAIAADWLPPEDRGRRKLKALTEQEKDEVLALLETSLGNHRLEAVPEMVKGRLLKTLAQDIEELKASLDKRADILTERAKRKLTERGEKEAIAMVEILKSQQKRILENYESTRFRQLELDLDIGEEKRQLESDRRHWEKRLAGLEQEMITEPERIREVYQVKAQRIEPVGLVYLYPVSG
jgi:SNF2 family DNA or RNA helicase